MSDEQREARIRAEAFKEARDAVNDWYIAAGQWGAHGPLGVLSDLQRRAEDEARNA